MTSLLLLSLLTAVLQDPQTPAPRHDTPPRYRTHPRADAFNPRTAKSQAVSGQAVIGCTATAAGALDACRVVEETPTGWGFGQAALDASATISMVPALSDGRPVDAAVQLRIQFQNHSTVLLDCADVGDGTVRDCRVVQEWPQGRGLGAAFASRTTTAPDQAPVRNGRVRFRADVAAPFEACPVINGQPTCEAP